MIVKKVARRSSSANLHAGAAYVVRLTRYIVDADIDDLRKLKLHEDLSYAGDLGRYLLAENGEKVRASGSMNLLGKELNEWQMEMRAHMHRCPNSSDAMDHFVISWAADDHPSEDEAEESVRIFVRGLGLDHCPTVWAMHQDTDNLHVHLAILRIDPITGLKIGKVANGWDIDAAHRSLALVEAAYPKWHRNDERGYEVKGTRLIRYKTGEDVGPADDPRQWRTASAPKRRIRSAEDKLDDRSLRYESETGLCSHRRVALEVAIPLMLEAADWPSLHQALAKEGIGLERSSHGRGAKLSFNGVFVSASIHDKTSYQEMVKRLGNFEPRSAECVLAPYKPRQLPGQSPLQSAYFAARSEHAMRVKQALAEANCARGGYFIGTAAGVRRMVTAECVYPSYNDWLSGSRPPDPMDIATAAFSGGAIGATSAIMSTPQVDIQGFSGARTKKAVVYRRMNEPYGRPALVDIGSKIFVNESSDEAIRIALRMMAQRNGGRSLYAFGPPEFIARAKEIAAKEGIPMRARETQPSSKIAPPITQQTRTAKNQDKLPSDRNSDQRIWGHKTFDRNSSPATTSLSETQKADQDPEHHVAEQTSPPKSPPQNAEELRRAHTNAAAAARNVGR